MMASDLQKNVPITDPIQIVALIGGSLIALSLLLSDNMTLQWTLAVPVVFATGWAVIRAWSKPFADRAVVLFLRRIYLLSFVFRLTFLLALYAANQVFDYPLFQASAAGSLADDMTYHDRAIEIAHEIKTYGYWRGLELSQAFYLGNFGYGYLTAVVYHVLGEPNTMVIRLINILFGSLTPLLCFFIADSVYGQAKISRLSALFAAMYPSFIVLSSLQYKDTIVIFLTLLIIWYVLRTGGHLATKNIVLLLSALLILATFRSIVAISLMCLIIIYVLSRRGVKPATVFIISGFLIMSFSLAYWLIEENYLRFYYLSNLFDITEDVKYQYFRSPAYETSLTARFGSQETLLGTALFNFLIFMVAPLPNPNLGLLKFALPGVWMWYFLIPLSIYGLYFSIRYVLKEAWMLYMHVIIVFCMIMISTFVSNFRYRTLIMPILLMFASIGMFYFKRIKLFYLAYIMLIPIAALAYIFIKYYA